MYILYHGIYTVPLSIYRIIQKNQAACCCRNTLQHSPVTSPMHSIAPPPPLPPLAVDTHCTSFSPPGMDRSLLSSMERTAFRHILTERTSPVSAVPISTPFLNLENNYNRNNNINNNSIPFTQACSTNMSPGSSSPRTSMDEGDCAPQIIQSTNYVRYIVEAPPSPREIEGTRRNIVNDAPSPPSTPRMIDTSNIEKAFVLDEDF
eukprot:GHVO01068166.1.p2 GENE.GHVO01068166.1~~GHVO01068166.1.p2  ORF type:complete len:205 (+),score=40.51 GHVO01068166.1:1193-1807(+)